MQPALRHNPRRRKHKMIMIVDDDMEMAENCSMYLEACGFDVAVAADGIEALARMHGHTTELLISDCEMPHMNGLQLSKALRADPSTARMPILLMSGSMRCEVADGVSYDAFLRKPFLAETLLSEVVKLIDNVRSHPSTSKA